MRVLDRIRLLQLDSVSVVARAHYLPVFSRLGPYPRQLLDDAAWVHPVGRPRPLVEYWAHEASLIPARDWPLLRSGAKKPGWWQGYAALAAREPELVSAVLAAVKEQIWDRARTQRLFGFRYRQWLELDGITPGECGDLVSALGVVTSRNAGARPVSMVPR